MSKKQYATEFFFYMLQLRIKIAYITTTHQKTNAISSLKIKRITIGVVLVYNGHN